MKATIKIATARKEFRQDQINIMKRVQNVLEAHDLSIEIRIKQKVVKEIKISKLKSVSNHLHKSVG